MNKFEHAEYWIKSAEHDLATAETLFISEKYDWCLFICHIVIEKGIKAVYVLKHDNSIPPKIHNLVRLAELSNMEATEDQLDLLDHINDFNIEARYPDYKFSFYTTCTREYTDEYLQKIKEMFKWIKSLILLNQ